MYLFFNNVILGNRWIIKGEKMKKTIIFLLILIGSMFLNVRQAKVNAFEYNDSFYDMFDIEDLNDYSISTNTIVNRKYIGKYYNVGIMGHRRVIELGELISLKYVVLAASDNYFVGSISGIQQLQTNSYSITKSVTSSQSVAIGFIQVTSAAVNLYNAATVGTSNTTSYTVTFTNSTTYASESYTSTATSVQYDISKVYPGMDSFKVGQVALVAEFQITKSYTEERNIFGVWKKLTKTEKTNYSMYHYLDTVSTFIYTDSFGTSDSGLYYLGVIDLD